MDMLQIGALVLLGRLVEAARILIGIDRHWAINDRGSPVYINNQSINLSLQAQVPLCGWLMAIP